MKNTTQETMNIVEIPSNNFKIKIFNKNIKYLKPKDIKRAYSRLIQGFCRGEINSDEAKTICYMFSGYLQLIRDVEFEERLSHLEEKIETN